MKRAIFIIICIILSTVIWLNSLHYLFKVAPASYYSDERLSSQAERILNYHINIWKDPDKRARFSAIEHENNPEWDFMWRTFLVVSMTNIVLREPHRKEKLLPIIDIIIEDTIKKISQNSMYYFLMNYATSSPWALSPPASLFHDGEIALMINCRRLLEDDEEYKMLSKKYLDAILANMQRCPLLSAESYPNECWLFCNTLSLVALRIADYLDGADYSEFIRQWLANAKKRLVDHKTGLLYSAYTIEGHPIHGPEGSSIWMATHCLNFVDSDFAKQQFTLAKKELFVELFKFGFSREWPLSWNGQLDCDAGGIFALLHASPSASVFAMLAARTFEDNKMADAILTSLNFGGFPSGNAEEMKFNSSNLVGDVSVLYALVQGAIQKKILSNER